VRARDGNEVDEATNYADWSHLTACSLTDRA
jgi:hypothetical protein